MCQLPNLVKEYQVPPKETKRCMRQLSHLVLEYLGRGRGLLRLETVSTKVPVTPSPVPIVDTSEPDVSFEVGIFFKMYLTYLLFSGKLPSPASLHGGPSQDQAMSFSNRRT